MIQQNEGEKKLDHHYWEKKDILSLSVIKIFIIVCVLQKKKENDSGLKRLRVSK